MLVNPDLPDRAGFGAMRTLIDRLVKDWRRLLDRGEHYDAKFVERRLDQARLDFHRLYGRKVPPHGQDSETNPSPHG